MKKLFYILLNYSILSCSYQQERLPFLGNPILTGNDTIYPKIKKISFIDQDISIITNMTFRNKIDVADFIFLSYPSICPKMNTELNQAHTIFKNNPEVDFLSDTIDPKYDSIKRLNEYGFNKIWCFVTRNRDNIYSIATKTYLSTAYKDSKEPKEYVHSGRQIKLLVAT